MGKWLDLRNKNKKKEKIFLVSPVLPGKHKSTTPKQAHSSQLSFNKTQRLIVMSAVHDTKAVI
jgi:hypothetical protein